MADLWLIARDRTDRLTDAETVRLGRVLVRVSETSRIWFPPEAPTATVVVRDGLNELSDAARGRVHEILGPFDIELRKTRA